MISVRSASSRFSEPEVPGSEVELELPVEVEDEESVLDEELDEVVPELQPTSDSVIIADNIPAAILFLNFAIITLLVINNCSCHSRLGK